MAPTFNTAPAKTVVTVTGTVGNGAYGTITEGDVRLALEETARQNGVTVSDLTVSVERREGERTVTLTEAEYQALTEGRNAA